MFMSYVSYFFCNYKYFKYLVHFIYIYSWSIIIEFQTVYQNAIILLNYFYSKCVSLIVFSCVENTPLSDINIDITDVFKRS